MGLCNVYSTVSLTYTKFMMQRTSLQNWEDVGGWRMIREIMTNVVYQYLWIGFVCRGYPLFLRFWTSAQPAFANVPARSPGLRPFDVYPKVLSSVYVYIHTHTRYMYVYIYTIYICMIVYCRYFSSSFEVVCGWGFPLVSWYFWDVGLCRTMFAGTAGKPIVDYSLVWQNRWWLLMNILGRQWPLHVHSNHRVHSPNDCCNIRRGRLLSCLSESTAAALWGRFSRPTAILAMDSWNRAHRGWLWMVYTCLYH